MGSIARPLVTCAESQAAEALVAEAAEAAHVSGGATGVGIPRLILAQQTVAVVADPLLSAASALPPPAALKAVLFDIDGTLTDSDPMHFRAFRDMLQEVGFNGGRPIDLIFFQQRISGRHNPDIGRDLFPEWDEARQTAWLEAKEARFRQLASSSTSPVPGLPRVCSWLSSLGLRAAAVTNAPRANAEQLLKALGLDEFFQELVIGSECSRAKPFPDPYQEAMLRLGVKPDECFAFEDSPPGMRSAVAAHLATVGVLTGNTEAALVNAGAALVVKDFNDPRLWSLLEPQNL